MGGRGGQRPFLHRRPGAGLEGAPDRGTLPEGGRAKHERVAVPAWMGRLGLPYRGQRLAGAASKVFLHLLKPAAIRPDLGKPCSRSRTISASSARPPSPPHIGSHAPVLRRAGPESPGPVTGTKRPWSPRTPRHFSRASAGGLTSSTWNRPNSRRSSSSSTATSRTASATESTWSGAARTPWPMPSSRHGARGPGVTECSKWRRLGRRESVNALVGVWARNMTPCAPATTSSTAPGHWDHIYVTQLLSNRSCRPMHDFVMASESGMHSQPCRPGTSNPQNELRLLPGPAQKVPGPRGRPGPRTTPRPHARAPLRGGQGPRRPVPDPPNRGECMRNIDTWKVAD